MATLVLGAAGAAIGGSIGGSVLGVSAAMAGRAIGSTLGRVLDQRVMGQGSAVVEQGRVDRFRLTSASEGAPLARVLGGYRVSGQIIWSSRFLENRETTQQGGGKGTAPTQTSVEYSYSVSLAVALCEGPIDRIGRVWADGVEIAKSDLNLRIYKGADDQLPDPTIEAIEGIGNVPAYRGLAYVLLENLDLSQFGNRVPQLSFEVDKRAQTHDLDVPPLAQDLVNGIAVIPGTGEYSYATEPVNYRDPFGGVTPANVHTTDGRSDFVNSLEDATETLPALSSVLMVTSWFGDDLRCGSCQIKPKVERVDQDGDSMPWAVAGLTRFTAEQVAKDEGRSVYGGTPSDAAVIQGIQAIKDAGKACAFYPFILMELLDGNGKPNPWNPTQDQPPLPWRGRITSEIAPGLNDSPDGSQAAADDVDTFFGAVRASDFTIQNGAPLYSGPQEWTFSRYILHNAALCAAAGGVDAFCIGSELRSLTQIRGPGHSFPFVEKLRQLLNDVRVLLPDAKLGYAADWSEYFGYHSHDGNVYYHLDPLWAEPELDFIGIDNYMPLSDWRDGEDHADAAYGSIYNLDYLKANIEGGEGYDWYYPTPESRADQRREPITDGAFEEPWVFRNKDLRNWWQLTHNNRIDGVRSAEPTVWEPRSKPIWFTEVGCAAIDKGTNEPNVFLDAASSESKLPRFSNGARDDFIQNQYLTAMLSYWNDPDVNPTSDLYEGRMIDVTRTHVWAWDARPWPAFPNNDDVWKDSRNYDRGHWINGRITKQPLANVIAEICTSVGVNEFDVSQVYGLLGGTAMEQVQSARSDIQPMLLAYGIEVVEQDGTLIFKMRRNAKVHTFDTAGFVAADSGAPAFEKERQPFVESPGRVRVEYADAQAAYDVRVSEATMPGEDVSTVASLDLPLALTLEEGQAVAERWRAETNLGRTTVNFALPPSCRAVSAGDLVDLHQSGSRIERYRVDRVRDEGMRRITATRHDTHFYEPARALEFARPSSTFVPMVPITMRFLDLPIISPKQDPISPFVAGVAQPWPGGAAIYSSGQDSGYVRAATLPSPSIMGTTLTDLAVGPFGVWDNGPALSVRIASGILQTASQDAVLSGANAMAIGDGSSGHWEIFQFEEARLTGENTYDIVGRLRGQRGTEQFAANVWPTGSIIVLLQSLSTQIELTDGSLGTDRHLRFGPAGRPFTDPTYQYRVEKFEGAGLRPFRPVHLRVRDNGTDVTLRWTRRTRVDGDRWDTPEVPLNEASEHYLVTISDENGIVVQQETSQAFLELSAGVVASVRAQNTLTFAVAQISERYGLGPEAAISFP